MQRVLSLIVYYLICCVSFLPFRLLYIVSDLLYLIFYYIIRYRKQLVLNNLKKAFPNYSKNRLLEIRKKFYKHFIDVFIELIKSFTISRAELLKRYKVENAELIQNLKTNKTNIISLGSHYGNWEWIIDIHSQFPKYKSCIAAYSKIKPQFIDNVLKKTRSKFGLKLIKSNIIVKIIKQNIESNVSSICFLLCDQSPQVKPKTYWTKFMGVSVPVFVGGEMLARKYGLAVYFLNVTKTKRGFYSIKLENLTEDASKEPIYQITEKYLRKLESQIYKEPAYYLWSHKRFKHKDRAPS